MAWVAAHAPAATGTVLDLGGRDLNGSPRHLFDRATSYTVLDLRPGPGVDMIGDATRWRPPPRRRYDAVVCCEVLEHVEQWRRVVTTCFAALNPGGLLILTCAAPMRPAHSGVLEGPLQPGEWYRGVNASELKRALYAAGFRQILLDVQPHPADVRAVARRPFRPRTV